VAFTFSVSDFSELFHLFSCSVISNLGSFLHLVVVLLESIVKVMVFVLKLMDGDFHMGFSAVHFINFSF
jgi:hypothetical protein